MSEHHSYFICPLLYDVMNSDDAELFDNQGFALHDAHERSHARLARLLALGAEPYWMQDIRLATGRIEAHRAILRKGRSEESD
jgi:hypothetical protein